MRIPFRPPLPPLLHPRRLTRLTSSTTTTTTTDRILNPPATPLKPHARLPPPSPYIFIPSHSLFAKRPPRPFPPPYNTPPISSFSDPLNASAKYTLKGYTRPSARTEGASFLSGLTNGDDAILATSTHLAVADGVGAWNTRSHGHAALWSRLMLHFWSNEMSRGEFGFRRKEGVAVDPVLCLQEAYKATIAATSAREDDGVGWQGTTTATCAVLRGEKVVLMNLGDSVAMVYRPGGETWVARTTEQWHWFDCPRQLGTNSPDTPVENAVCQEVEVREGDLVLLATDGLVDNAWDEDILAVIREVEGLGEEAVAEESGEGGGGGDRGRMAVLADRLVDMARRTAIDPFAESPYMQRSIEEGLGLEGGKFDDISVVVAVCRKR